MRRVMVAGIVALSCVCAGPVPVRASAPPPDGRLVYSDAFGGSGLRVLPATGGVAHRLPETRGGLRPQWSPDGQSVAFVGRRGAIAWIGADGSDRHVLIRRRTLPNRRAIIGTLAWAPDGSALLFSLQRGPHPALYRADLGTGAISLLLRNATQPDWSASAGRIAAVRGGSIVTFAPDGSDVRRVVVDAAVDPEWSPDGTRILYQRDAADSDVYVIDADGSHRTRLTNSTAVDWSPTWSPDGSRIAWARSRTRTAFDDLFTMRADGSDVTRLTHTPTIDEYEPDWAA